MRLPLLRLAVTVFVSTAGLVPADVNHQWQREFDAE